MKNRKIMLLLFFMMLCIPFSAKAATLGKFPIRVDDKYVTKVYTKDGETHVGRSATQFLTVDQLIAYCVDFSVALGVDSGAIVWNTSDATWQSLPLTEVSSLREYLINTNNINESDVDAVINNLNLIYYFGYHTAISNINVSNNVKFRYLATQALLWETLSSAGMYRNISPNKLNDLFSESKLDELYPTRGNGLTVNYTINNIRYMKMPGSGSNQDGLTFDPSAVVTGADTAKANITAAINSYKNDKPSMCGKTYEIEVNSSKTIEDTNEMLSQYSVSCNNDAGVTCSKNGNNLIIGAGSSITNGVTITLKRELTDVAASTPTVYKYTANNSSNSERQGLATFGRPDPVSCTVTVKVKKPTPVPGCVVCAPGKTEDDFHYVTDTPDLSTYPANCYFYPDVSEDKCHPEETEQCWVCTDDSGENSYYFAVTPPEDLGQGNKVNCHPHPGLDKDHCKPNPGCYVCESGYVWSEDGEPVGEEDCVLQEDINDEANCIPEPIDTEPSEFTPPTSGLRIAYISLLCGMAAAIAFVYFYSKRPKSE